MAMGAALRKSNRNHEVVFFSLDSMVWYAMVIESQETMHLDGGTELTFNTNRSGK